MTRSLLDAWSPQQAARVIHDDCRAQGNVSYASIIEVIRDVLVEYGYTDKAPSVRTVKAWLAATPVADVPRDVDSGIYHQFNMLRIRRVGYDDAIEQLAVRHRISTRTVKRKLAR